MNDISPKQKVFAYIQLIRLDKPIGIFLLLWPCYWALWSAAEGMPPLSILIIFTAGVVLMRSFGCAINDFADRNFDGQVSRTKNRPLASGIISSKEALLVAALLLVLAFIMVLFTSITLVIWAIPAAILASFYPFTKRFTHLPQLFLGAAFAWAIPMAYIAVKNEITIDGWLLFLITIIWTLAYDTIYALMDQSDDVKAGIKSSALLFGKHQHKIICLLFCFVILSLAVFALLKNLSLIFYSMLAISLLLFYYQLQLIKTNKEDAFFKAFKNNHYVGLIIFFGLFCHYQFF